MFSITILTLLHLPMHDILVTENDRMSFYIFPFFLSWWQIKLKLTSPWRNNDLVNLEGRKYVLSKRYVSKSLESRIGIQLLYNFLSTFLFLYIYIDINSYTIFPNYLISKPIFVLEMIITRLQIRLPYSISIMSRWYYSY